MRAAIETTPPSLEAEAAGVMAAATGISWTNATWNPTVGCSKVSTGCRECYAEEVHEKRLNGVHGYPVFRPWTALNAEHNVTLMPHKLDQPLRWRKPRMVFVNSMSDLFHEQIPDEYIAQVFAVMAAAAQHTFQILTKRPERMHALLNTALWGVLVDNAAREAGRAPVLPNRMAYYEPLPNVWLGVSIENRKWVGRADVLRETPAAVRFISAEPLLGPLIAPDVYASDTTGELEAYWPDGYDGHDLDLAGIDWLIVGGESGSGHRPFDVAWARDLRDACDRSERSEWCDGAGIDRGETYRPCPRCDGRGVRTAFFVKQLGGARPGTALEDLPPDLRIREFPDTARPETTRR
jgi:protein gp37